MQICGWVAAARRGDESCMEGRELERGLRRVQREEAARRFRPGCGHTERVDGEEGKPREALAVGQRMEVE